MSLAVIEKLHDIPQLKEVGLCRRQHPHKLPLQIKCLKGNQKGNIVNVDFHVSAIWHVQFILCMNLVLAARQLTESKLVRFSVLECIIIIIIIIYFILCV